MQNYYSNKNIEKLYLLFFICLPLLFSKFILDPFFLPRLVFTIIFLGVLLIRLFNEKRFNHSFISKNFSIQLIFLYLFISLISFHQSLVISESHAVLSRQIPIAVFFIITCFLLSEKLIRLENLIKSVLCFGIIAIVISLFAILNKTINGQHLFRQVDMISGTFANKNLLSSILFLCLPFYFMVLDFSKKYRLLSIIAILLTVFIVVVLRTRTVLLALIIFFVLLLFYSIRLKFKPSRKKLISTIIVFLIATFLLFKLYLERKIQNLHSSYTISIQYFYRLFSSDTLESRIFFWKNSIAMFKDNYLLGVGLGNWSIYFPRYGLNDFNNFEISNGIVNVQNPHNDFLWVLCETGIFGFLFYYGFLFFSIYQSIWLVKNSKTNAEKWFFYYLFSGIIGYLIISFFDFPSSRIEHQVVLMVILAIINSFYYKDKAVKTNNKSRLIFYLSFVVCLGYTLFITLKRYESESHILKLTNAKTNKNWETTISEADNASSYFYKIDSKSLPLDWYKGIAYFNQNEFLKSAAFFQDAYSKNPYNINVINNYASSLEKNLQRGKAILLYNKALEISNGFEEARLNLAACYYNEKAFEKAFLTIDKCDINTRNSNYKTFLIPILQQKANAILLKVNDPVLNQIAQNKVKTSDDLFRIYKIGKEKNLTFENQVKHLK